MASLYYELGWKAGWKIAEAQCTWIALTGLKKEALHAEYILGHNMARPFYKTLEPDSALNYRLKEIGGRLTRYLEDPYRRFSFRITNEREVNGFALPGGFIFVTRSLAEVSDPDELAFVLGHEMGHVVRRHAIGRMKANMALRAALMPMRAPGGLIGQQATQLAIRLLQQNYSQENELEADEFGLRLIQKAGYDAAAGARFLNKLPKNSGNTSALSKYLASHPPTEVRVRNLDRLLKR